MEMLALACSVTSIKVEGLNVKAAAYCLAAINMTKKALHGHSKITKCFQLVASLFSDAPIPIRHVRAHPEKRLPDNREWTDDDWGIFKADQLAGDENPIIPSLDEEWVLQELTNNLDFRIVRIPDRSIFFEDLDHHCSLTNIQAYLKERNALREMRLTRQDHRWSPIYLPLITLLHDPRVSPNAWATTLRIVWDKSWHGANKTKTKKPLTDSDRCPHCNEFEDQAHIILHCPRGKELRDKLDSVMKEKYNQPTHVCQIIMMYYFFALSNHTLWTGALDANARDFIQNSLNGTVLSNNEWSLWAKALRTIGESARQISIEHSLPEKKTAKLSQQELPWDTPPSTKRYRSYRKPLSKPHRKFLRLSKDSRKGIG